MHIIRHPSFRWLLSITLLILMGYQLWSRSNHFETFNLEIFSEAGWYIALVAVMMPLNWWLETKKWHGLLSVHAEVPFSRAFQAVTSGIALSLFTPNRIGEYGGRLLKMPYAIRWPVALSTLMGSVSQNLISFTAGIVAFIFLFDDLLPVKILGLGLIILCTVSFFHMQRVVGWICKMKIHRVFAKLATQLIHLEDYTTGLLTKTLLIAFARYVVYTAQFVLLLHAFGSGSPIISMVLGVSCLYLFQTLIPLPPVADVLARTNIALILWSGSGMSELSISLASFTVWMINLLIPAVLGSLAIGTIDLKKSFNTHDPHFSPSYKPLVTEQSKGS